MIVDEVTTLVGPGELIDVVATERGLAINPRRQDLLERARGSKVPLKTIQAVVAIVSGLEVRPLETSCYPPLAIASLWKEALAPSQ